MRPSEVAHIPGTVRQNLGVDPIGRRQTCPSKVAPGTSTKPPLGNTGVLGALSPSTRISSSGWNLHDSHGIQIPTETFRETTSSPVGHYALRATRPGVGRAEQPAGTGLLSSTSKSKNRCPARSSTVTVPSEFNRPFQSEVSWSQTDIAHLVTILHPPPRPVTPLPAHRLASSAPASLR